MMMTLLPGEYVIGPGGHFNNGRGTLYRFTLAISRPSFFSSLVHS